MQSLQELEAEYKRFSKEFANEEDEDKEDTMLAEMRKIKTVINEIITLNKQNE